MNNNTQTGLKILIIGMVLSVINGVFTFLANNLQGVASVVLNGFGEILAPISFILLLIGLIIIFMGRKEFGKKHKKFVTVSLILFIVSIIVAVVLFVYIFISIFSFFTSYDSLSETIDIDFIKNLFLKIIFITVIAGFIEALYQVFMVHELENKKGKTVLYAAFAITIVTSLSVAFIAVPMVDELIEGVNEENEKQLDDSNSVIWGEDISSSEQDSIESSSAVERKMEKFNTQLNVISSLGIVGQILFLFAFFIAYKRIKNDELIPALPGHLKRCRNCGRVVQSDHLICAYCGNHFNEFHSWR